MDEHTPSCSAYTAVPAVEAKHDRATETVLEVTFIVFTFIVKTTKVLTFLS